MRLLLYSCVLIGFGLALGLGAAVIEYHTALLPSEPFWRTAWRCVKPFLFLTITMAIFLVGACMFEVSCS